MSEGTTAKRLSKVAKEFNIGISTIIEFLGKKGIKVDNNPNAKIDESGYELLLKEFQQEKKLKEAAFGKVAQQVERKTIVMDQSEIETQITDSEAKKGAVQPKHEEATLSERVKNETLPGLKILGKLQEKPKPEPESKDSTGEKPDLEVKESEKTTPPVKEIEKQEEPEIKKGPKIMGMIDLSEKPSQKKKDQDLNDTSVKIQEAKEQDSIKPLDNETPEPAEPAQKPITQEEEIFKLIKVEKLAGPTILGTMQLPGPKAPSKPASVAAESQKSKRRKRKRLAKEEQPKDTPTPTPTTDKPPKQEQQPAKGRKTLRRERFKPEVTEEEIQKQVRETLAALSSTGGKSKGSKHRRLKRDIFEKKREQEMEKEISEGTVLKVTEFVSASELATMMNVSVNEIIGTCMSLGLFVSINQRLDAEIISIVAGEFGFEVEFVGLDDQKDLEEDKDSEEDLKPRAPIITVMGHVDHGKTSLLDRIRNTNVIAGEAGGITQHIGAYSVELDSGKTLTFLDTPGHEAFTAMRARGAKVTDVAIVVVAADDNVMPQTVEAINHAQAANVPIVFAINKMDKAGANPEKVKEELSKLNILVEDWGGKYQSQEISAKMGINIDQLLEKVILESEMLDLKANPKRKAKGTVIESSLDKGRGYVSTVLVQTGTLKIGDIVVAGVNHGKIKAMFNERGQRVTEAGPSAPVLILGLDGAPQAGDLFNVMESESDAKSITNRRQRILREQGLRTQKHITLDEIGRRIAIGDFKELNIIVKGDVDGSVEALSDALLKLTTNEVQVNIIHKAVGPITEGDVLLATASNAVIVGFQVRPSLVARKLAENEQIDIRLYSVIYNAINEIKSAIEGMLSPDIEEKILANIEVREVFKITKVGTVAGCMVLDGKIHRNSSIRLIRDGIVVYTGRLGSLKRFKDDVKEVNSGYECGLNIDKFNDLKVGDIIEAFETIEIARTLD